MRLAPQGLWRHINSLHPGMQTKPNSDGSWPGQPPALEEQQPVHVATSTVDFLNRAMEEVKTKRLALKVKLDEVSRLEAEDARLSSEQEVLQRAIDDVVGRRGAVDEHSSVSEVAKSRGHQRGTGATI